MKALVVGGPSGQVARELAALSDAAASMDVRGRPQLDLTNPVALSSAVEASKPDVVICCGAYTAVDQAETEPTLAHDINANGPAALAKACAAANIPIVHLSTDYVFDGAKAGPYLETDLPNPQGVYGATKLAGEMAVAASGARYVILRVSWVHAPQGKNFVRTMLRLAGSRDRINVVADQVGRPTYAPHLAAAIRDISIRLAQDPSAPTGLFHLTGSGDPCSWHQFAESVFEASRSLGGPKAVVIPIPSSEYPTPAKRPANSVLDCTRIASAYGIVMPHWSQGVEECVDAVNRRGWDLA